MDGYAADPAAPPVAQDPALNQGYPPQPYQQPTQAPYPQAAGQPPYQPNPAAYPPGQYPQQPYPTKQYPSDAPPSYYPEKGQQMMQPLPVQQQTSNVEVKIVQQQPAPRAVVVTSYPVQDRFLTLSVIMVICGFCCGFAFLLCTLPALFIAISARDDDRRGDPDSARTKGRIALGLNLAAVACWVILFIIVLSINVANTNNR